MAIQAVMSIQHHRSGKTWYDRYPDIFQHCVDYYSGRGIRILSFGCSTGEEVATLRDIYFSGSIIHGVDIDPKAMIGWQHLESKSVSLSSSPSGMYDLVFCMSVLCYADAVLDGEYFSRFDRQLVDIDSHLNVGGLLVVYDSAFLMSDSSIYERYEPMREFEESGFVEKHDRVGNLIKEPYKHVIFFKRSMAR